METREFSASGIITENEGYVGLHLFSKNPKRAVTRFLSRVAGSSAVILTMDLL